MKAINIIGICLAVILFPLCLYYIEETWRARWAGWDWGGYGNSYYGPSASEISAQAAGISILIIGFFIFQSIMNLTKVKTTTSKVMSIISMSLMGIAFLINLAVIGGASTYDEGGLVNLGVPFIMLAFSIVFLVQSVNFEKKGESSDNEIIDNQNIDEII